MVVGGPSALWPCVTATVMPAVVDTDRIIGNEAGTPPGDRRFRPDVQGLRAVAILLVVLFHADVPGISGGYVGVDVFFVISGFVITGVLLRDARPGQTSVLGFYARRARRIIPAASLVIIVTVVAAFHYLGSLTGRETAVDGQWAAVFLANFHFTASATNYLASQQPPSALQNYLVAGSGGAVLHRLSDALLGRRQPAVRRSPCAFGWRSCSVAVIVASYAFSIVFTSANPSSAFFSPFTRAWELALGGLIAVSGDTVRRLPRRLAATCTWVGLGAIVVSSIVLTSASVYPGSLVAFPVLGAGLVIAGGAAQPEWGVEWLLRPKAVPVARPHLVFAVSVALADPHHCHPAPWSDGPSRVGEPAVVTGCNVGGSRNLSSPREPDTPLQTARSASMGECRDGPLSHRRDVGGDDI